MQRFLARSVVILLAGVAGHAAAAPIDPPDHSPRPGVLRVAAHPAMAGLLGHWATAYAKHVPGGRIEAMPRGSDVAMAALYTASADIALLGREATESEVKAFEWIYRYRPMRIEIATGSVATPGSSPALAVFVHRDNPLASITLAQLDAAFGSELRRGGQPVRTWSQLGVHSALADKPLRLYAPDAESGSGRFFRQVVLLDSNRLRWDALTEYAPEKAGRAGSGRAAADVLAALAGDPAGLAVADAAAADARVKMLAVAPTPEARAFRADRKAVANRDYVLARTLYAYVNRPPSAKLDPRLGAFLAWLVGREGQAIVARSSAYLPLPSARAMAQRASITQESP